MKCSRVHFSGVRASTLDDGGVDVLHRMWKLCYERGGVRPAPWENERMRSQYWSQQHLASFAVKGERCRDKTRTSQLGKVTP